MKRFISLLLYFAVLLAAPCEIARGAYYYAAASAGGGGSNLLTNPGFESFTGTQDNNSSDTFASWTVTTTTGYIDATATVHAGSNAAKLHGGASDATYLTQNITVTASTSYTLSFWCRGDGIGGGGLDYYIYDNTHSSYIKATTSSGVTGTTYTQITWPFSTPSGCVSVEIGFRVDVGGGDAYVDDSDVH